MGDVKVLSLDEMNEVNSGERRGRGPEPQGGEVGLARGQAGCAGGQAVLPLCW